MKTIAYCLSLATLLTIAAPARAETKGPFEVKSGVFEVKITTQGQSTAMMKGTFFFDDYGLVLAGDLISGGGFYPGTDVPVPPAHSLGIDLADGTRHDIDLDKKTGTSKRISPRERLETLDPALKKGAKVTSLPPRVILGRTCPGKEIVEESGKALTREWMWKGIPLRVEQTSTGANSPTVVLETTSLSVAPAPAEKFRLPAGVK